MRHAGSQVHIEFSRTMRWVCCSAMAVGLAMVPTGCQDKSQSPEANPIQAAWDVSVLEDTIESVASLEGLNPIYVQGYGVVIGLEDTGSRECPEYILEIIREGLRGRKKKDGKPILGQVNLRELLEHASTAVVVVEGMIPPAAAAGDKIDLTIQALPGTQTTSLAGGKLFVTELSIERRGTSGEPVRTKPMALAGDPEPAPVFMDPFTAADPAERPSWLRSARIIGGGRVLRTRPLRLVLRDGQGSYRLVKKIADRLNFRFPTLPGEHPVADGENDTTIKIVIPREFHGQEYRFLMLLLQTYLYGDPVLITQRTEELIRELANPQSDAERITAALESIGNSTVPALRESYGSSGPRLVFYAARTAARLGDKRAVPVLSRITLDESSPHQLQATIALGELPIRYEASHSLRPLLDSKQTMVRIQAYEALAKRNDPVVVRQVFERSAGFGLDVVISNGPPLIYVKTMKEPRIVLFGQGLSCQRPVFYISQDKLLTVSSTEVSKPDTTKPSSDAQPGDQQLLLLRCTPSGSVGLKLFCSTDLVELIKKLGSDIEPDYQRIHHGLGLDYSQTVAAIYGLQQNKFIDASFALQPTDTAINLIERSAPAIQRPETSSP